MCVHLHTRVHMHIFTSTTSTWRDLGHTDRMHASLLLCSNLHGCICALKKCNSHVIGTVRTQKKQSEADSVCINLRVVSCGKSPLTRQSANQQEPDTWDTGHRAQLHSLLCESNIVYIFLWERSFSLASTELIQVVLCEVRTGLRKGPVTKGGGGPESSSGRWAFWFWLCH